MSKDIPIIFSGPMVRALLEGRKTMTRRLAYREIPHKDMPNHWHMVPTPWQRVKAGDRLYVRENHRLTDCGCTEACRGKGHVWYDADDSGYRHVSSNKLRPSIHMPRWASRLTLIVTATKIERLQDISSADAQSEGIVEDDGSEPDIWYVPGAAPFLKIQMASSAAPVFKSLWIALHGEGSWEQNPEVAAISVRVIKANIDAPEARLAA